MATSGSISTNSYNGRYLTFEWWRTNYSVDENWTEISWTLKGAGTAPSSWYYSGPFWVWFGYEASDGSTQYDLIWSSETRIQLYNGTTVASGSKRLWHYNDGSYSFQPWIRGAIYNTAWNVEAYEWFDLDSIPRTTIPTISNDVIEMGTSATISLPRASSSFTHNVTYSFGSASETISSNAGTSCTFTPPLSLANQIPNGTSGTGTITVKTLNGSTVIGTKYLSFTSTVPASVVPSITGLSITDPTNIAGSYNGYYIQSKSKVRIQVAASGAYSSSITGVVINDGLGTVTGANPYESNVITSSGSKTVTVTVTDSRGRSTSTTGAYTVLTYSPPSITKLAVNRCNNDGTTNDSGTYMKITFAASITSLNDKNGKSFAIQYKEQSSSTWTNAATKIDAYSWNSSVIVSAEAGSSYDVRMTAQDNFSTSALNTKIGTAFTLISFRNTGKGLAFGKVSEKNAFECALPAVISNGQISRNTGGGWIAGRDNAVVKQTRCTTYEGSSWNPVASVKTGLGNWTIGNVGGEKLAFSYDTDSNYNAGINIADQIYLEPRFGTIALKSDVEKQIGDVYFLVNSYMGSNVRSNNGDVAIAYGTTSMRNGQYLIFGVFHVKQSDGTGWARVSMDGSVVASAAVSSEAVGAARIAFLMGTLNLYQDKSVAWQVTINGTGAGTMSNIPYQNCILMALRVKGL